MLWSMNTSLDQPVAGNPGALVRARRVRLGLSQRAAAAICGIPQSMLSRIESGQTQPSLVTLERILGGLGAGLTLTVTSLNEASDERREKQRSVWLNRAVVGELARDPDRVIGVARENIARWREVHAERPSILAALDRWSQILDDGPDAIALMLNAQTEEAADLRQNSPFAGVLSPEQRTQVLASFRTYWERPHAASTTTGSVQAAAG